MISSQTAILLPMLCMIGLTFATVTWMFFSRVRTIRNSRINPQKLQTRDAMRQTLSAASQPADHFNNLLELPILFYFAILLIWLLQISDDIYLFLAWAFVGFRLVHSFIHLTYNRVMHRFAAFTVSSILLIVIWLRLSLHIILD